MPQIGGTLVFSQQNIQDTTNNNRLVYNFPKPLHLDGYEIALSQASLYYAWFNISRQLNNNTFFFTFPGKSVITIQIPDGMYQISDINSYLQTIMIANGYYLINSTNQYVYYAQFIVNTNAYSVELDLNVVPTSLPTNWTAPSNFAGFPATSYTPTISLLGNAFNKIIGFNNPNFGVGGSSQTSNCAVLSCSSNTSTQYPFPASASNTWTVGIAPQVQPNPTILVSLDCIDNQFANPTGTIFSITPNVPIGTQIALYPQELLWNRVRNGNYNQITLTMYQTNGNYMTLLDPNMTFILYLRKSLIDTTA